MTDGDLLTRVDLFAELEPEELARIAAAAEQRELRRGDVLFQENDEPNELFVVVSGRIALANKSLDGRESVVALMEAGDVFGEMPLFDGLGRSTEARPLEPSEIIAIPYGPVQEVYESRPMLLWSVVAMLSGRIRAMDAALADSVFFDVTGRTAKRLLELAGEADEFTLPVTQEELAGMVGASRERVNKAIAAFVRLDWLEPHERPDRSPNRPQPAPRAR